MQGDEFPWADRYDWQARTFLGEGSYGKVFRAIGLKDKQPYAIKEIKMQEFNKDPALMDSLLGEIKITKEINSDHTVRLLDAHVGKINTYMTLQVCDSDLRKDLSSRRFTEQECIKAFKDIMDGFKVLVSKGYIHRDVKPANVLVKTNNYKVADFGFACKADILGKKKLTEICGTPIYMAPQLLRNQPYSAKSDVWSLGLMLYEMIFGYTPWPCRTLDEYLNGIYSRPPAFPYDAQIGKETQDFIRRCLVLDEENRIGWTEIFDHPLIKHSHGGQSLAPIEVGDYTKQLLLRLQELIKRRTVNVREIFKKYQLKAVGLNITTFGQFLREIDPSITSHQIKVLYDYVDRNKDGQIDLDQAEEALIRVDYRKAGDLTERKLDELVAILKARGQKIEELFQEIDINRTGSLDWPEFSNFILKIAPRYTKSEILHIFQLLDSDKSGLITKKEFYDRLQFRLPSSKEHVISKQRAERNLSNFISFLRFSNITPAALIAVGDRNHDSTLQLDEFKALLRHYNFHISEEEIQELFWVIDKQNLGKISLQELLVLLH